MIGGDQQALWGRKCLCRVGRLLQWKRGRERVHTPRKRCVVLFETRSLARFGFSLQATVEKPSPWVPAGKGKCTPYTFCRYTHPLTDGWLHFWPRSSTPLKSHLGISQRERTPSSELRFLESTPFATFQPFFAYLTGSRTLSILSCPRDLSHTVSTPDIQECRSPPRWRR